MPVRSAAAAMTAMLVGLVPAGGAGAAELARVALLPIVVHAASQDSAYLSEGLVDMLAARLEQTGGISVLRIDSNSRSAHRLAVAVEAARNAGAQWVVFGSFTQFGSGASLDVRCARVSDGEEGEARRVFIQSGSLGEIIPKLDELASKLRRHVQGGATFAARAPGEAEDAAAAAAADAAALEELQRRVDALESAVYEQPSPAPEAAPQAGVDAPEASPFRSADAARDTPGLR